MAKPSWDEIQRRPYPPPLFIDNPDLKPYIRLIPADGVHEWLHSQIISEEGNASGQPLNPNVVDMAKKRLEKAQKAGLIANHCDCGHHRAAYPY